MKNIIKIFIIFLPALFLAQCTSDFDDINTRPDTFTSEEISAKYFFTGPQKDLFAPNRYPYWRAHLIHADRYAGQFCFGHNQSWWDDELGYTYSSGYTDAAWDWLAGYLGGIDNLMRMTKADGELPNQYLYSIAQIMKGMYFQMFTDVFGMVAYSEATNPDIALPKYDSQKDIYEGIIAELNEAMATIGDATRTGANTADIGSNDVYCNGDLQKWKKLANTLKLRIAMRALGAPGADFANAAITEALNAPLLETKADNVLMEKDTEISQWNSAAYGDVWYNFGAGSDWTVGKTLIDYLRKNNDPRLEKYAQPAVGGTQVMEKPAEGSNRDLFEKHTNYIFSILDDAGATYTKEVDPATGSITVTMPENTYYIGQPSRLNGKIKSHVKYDFFSKPNNEIIEKKNAGKIRAELIMSAAESYFLQAEAALKGVGSGDANALFQEGIRQAMLLWDVSEDAIATYLAQDIATLSGSMEEKMEKIATQRWIAAYTDGFEAWAIVRDSGYPKELANGVSDIDIYGLGNINGHYPQRMRYGNSAYNTNGSNVSAAVATQGPDVQDTKLWWAK